MSKSLTSSQSQVGGISTDGKMITATAIVTTAPEGTFEIRNITLKGMRSDEIIVRMVATGVCHTDFSCANVSSSFHP
ncbi:hypothetical protein H9L39_19014 [Fusarium oxysporum f. sp. albedinis]|nr:hypothetical protein H9L39_19014 [Fusarium oxysporum f. sp. albedinis]